MTQIKKHLYYVFKTNLKTFETLSIIYQNDGQIRWYKKQFILIKLFLEIILRPSVAGNSTSFFKSYDQNLQCIHFLKFIRDFLLICPKILINYLAGCQIIWRLRLYT